MAQLSDFLINTRRLTESMNYDDIRSATIAYSETLIHAPCEYLHQMHDGRQRLRNNGWKEGRELTKVRLYSLCVL